MIVQSDAVHVLSMPEPRVLVVDDDHHVGSSMGRLLTLEGIAHDICHSPRHALDLLKKSQALFWLIISDQRMPDMKGTVFLEKAKAISPETVCFLLTAHTDISAVVDSVNKGAVFKYILKPWNDDMLLSNIRSALKKFQVTVENRMLLETAIDQTKQLYRMGNKLAVTITRQKKIMDALAGDRESLSAEIQHSQSAAIQPDESLQAIEEKVAPDGQVDMAALAGVYRYFANQLFSEFEDLAGRNGFSMPGPGAYDFQR